MPFFSLRRLHRAPSLLMFVALQIGLGNPSTALAASSALQANASAPEFSRQDLNHRPVSVTAYRGKVIMLNFWATWCAPCLSEIPRFTKWQQQYGKQGLQVIGVSMDDGEQPVRVAYQKYGLNYPVVMGDEQLGSSYGGILGLPVTFLIDRDGKIRYRHQGAADFDILEREILSLLTTP